ncbi:MAG: NADH-quinone oxidoreductase subunit NuoH [Alphaproteobacteria bacterium]|nr:NADH-quinone oxidoreductase subunit NuoH [Alphaproteobacteria bacterium]
MLELWETYGIWTATTLMYIGLIVGVVLLAVAYYTYAERKVMGAIQRRQGPMMVGPFGLLQPIADGLKLFSKETIIPSQAHRAVFLIAPMMMFALSLVAWAVIPFNKDWVLANINVGVLYLVAISSMSVYGVIMAGWASNSRYAFLGGLRSASQMVSYEVSMGLIIVCVILCTGSLNLQDIVLAPRPVWMQVLLFPMFIVFLISILAETNRAPFDLPEGESEITGGFMVEYSAMTFALFFLGEYSAMILMSAITTILFLGGWLPPFGIAALAFVPGVVWFALKTALVMFVFLWARATLPRFRYDQLMRLGWKVFLPLTLAWVVLMAGILMSAEALPGQIKTDPALRKPVIETATEAVGGTVKGAVEGVKEIFGPSLRERLEKMEDQAEENLEGEEAE